ncbi:Serine/threonine-protein kinase 32B [Galemys pyrenaicus]|uniref:Serine/threonine-protein kinase 32B n=1 Tax=Galemys pyrenaicus TaxID=202257 RepID=A0A8J5ZSL1_GALPY|nr:Serine/threonine-protein kinase 32B [Galemys pyrenaicus]
MPASWAVFQRTCVDVLLSSLSCTTERRSDIRAAAATLDPPTSSLRRECVPLRSPSPWGSYSASLTRSPRHVHITDFNIATVVTGAEKASSMAGTKPYMAPEVFQVYVDGGPGYSYPVDWWSLGVTAYELLRGWRPYDIHAATPVDEVLGMLRAERVHYSSTWCAGMVALLRKLLTKDPESRLSSLGDVQSAPYLADVNWDAVLEKALAPGFVPHKGRLNCDPTFELEEMILESKPLHKKKKRLAKNRSKEGTRASCPLNGHLQQCLEAVRKEFIVFNREKLRSQQGPSDRLLDTEGQDGSPVQGKLQDGCNNNLLAHACSRGCSS